MILDDEKVVEFLGFDVNTLFVEPGKIYAFYYPPRAVYDLYRGIYRGRYIYFLIQPPYHG